MIQAQHGRGSLKPPAIPRRGVTHGALLPKQAAADGPPALDRFHVAGLPIVIAGEEGRVRLNVESEGEGAGVVFDAGGEVH